MRYYIDGETGFGDGGVSSIERVDIQSMQDATNRVISSYAVTNTVVVVPYASVQDQHEAMETPEPNAFMASLPA